MAGKGLGIWKVRASPCPKIASGRIPAMARPSKAIVPASGLRLPATRLKKVVLPAPFGPISPWIAPGATASDAPSTAFNPPKRLTRPSALSIAPSRATQRCGPGGLPPCWPPARASKTELS